MLAQTNALQQLLREEFRFDPLEVVGVEPEPTLSGGARPDWILELRWKDRTERFVVEYKSPATPKRLREAAGQAATFVSTDLRPMVMAPYLDSDDLDWLAEQEISGLDFSGNGVVVVPGTWFVYRTGKPNPYPLGRYIKSIYRGRSSLVGRVLILRQEFDTVTAVRDEIRARGGESSLSTVSKVLQSLEEELLVGRDSGVRLLQPGQLLDRLLGNFQAPEIQDRALFRTDDRDSLLGSLSSRAEKANVALAGRGESMWVSFPGAEETLAVYTRDLDVLEECAERVDKRGFADMELLETDDELVFFDRRRRGGFVWTSPLQTYLELASGGKRERETAEQMRDSSPVRMAELPGADPLRRDLCRLAARSPIIGRTVGCMAGLSPLSDPIRHALDRLAEPLQEFRASIVAKGGYRDPVESEGARVLLDQVSGLRCQDPVGPFVLFAGVLPPPVHMREEREEGEPVPPSRHLFEGRFGLLV